MPTKTDNSYLAEKIRLRIDNVPPADPLHVLDMFSGNGVLWDRVRSLTRRRIDVLRVDSASDRKGIYLHGDNRKFALDPRPFDVIDLDAYGVPFAQLERLFSSPARSGKTVFVTYIQSAMGRLPQGMLSSLGYTPEMVRKCPTLFCRNGLDKFLAYLALRGITSVIYFTDAQRRKTYLCIKT